MRLGAYANTELALKGAEIVQFLAPGILRLSLTRLHRILLFACFLLTDAAMAQQIEFQVDNVTLEQVITSESNMSSGLPDGALLEADDVGSGSFIFQSGDGNFASTGIVNSPGSLAAVLQSGDSNSSLAVIQDSPGSAIATVQIGDSNSTVAGIVGGSNNTIGTAQIGNNLGLAVGLENSEGTTVVYGQGGENFNGGIVIRNAPPGTVVTLN